MLGTKAAAQIYAINIKFHATNISQPHSGFQKSVSFSRLNSYICANGSLLSTI